MRGRQHPLCVRGHHDNARFGVSPCPKPKTIPPNTPIHALDAYRAIMSSTLTSARMGQIINYYANPSRPGTPAYRLARLICDNQATHDITIDLIQESVLARLRNHPDRPLTEKELSGICTRLGLERVLQRRFHIPASLYRAALLYIRALKDRGLKPQHTDRTERARIWDEAVRAHMTIQHRRLLDGSRSSIRWLPLSDGTTSNPNTPGRAMSCGGLDEWERLQRQWTGHDTRSFSCDKGAFHDQTAFAVPSNIETQLFEDEPFTPDLAWLEAHGITVERARRLSDRELEDAGVDPAAFRLMLERA